MKNFPLAPALSRIPTFVALIFLLLTLAAAPAYDDTQRKIPAALQQAFDQQKEADYLVIFSDTADLSGAGSLPDKVAKRKFVYDQLRAQALRTQSGARALLEKEKVSFSQHYLINAIEVRSGAAIAQKLAALPEVENLLPVVPIPANLPTPPPPTLPRQTGEGIQSIEWGVSRVHAPEVWSTYNVRGEGVVVGTADTGVQWNHPALKSHYRGWNGATADHNYNWHDAIHAPTSTSCGADTTVPCDDYGHGTHVTGTINGDDNAGNQIGVAPGAKWIGCRNMASGDGSIARYTECFEFLLAPYPFGGNPLTDGRPELAADIINNSWTCTAGEGCDAMNLNALRGEVQKLNAAGILVVAAAGNPGSSCNGVAEPPAIYAETFTIGAIDSSDSIASFSARGTVTSDGSNRRKPDVSAPGVNVRSSVPGNGYAYLSGTSMASPHTSGMAALLWSAVPSLSGNITQTIAIIEASADPRTTNQGCGGDSSSAVPNNVYGYGIVNALAAVFNAPRGAFIAIPPIGSTVSASDVVTYTILVANISNTNMTGAVVTDRVPLNTTYVPGSIRGLGMDETNAPLLRWNIGNLPTVNISGTLILSFAVTINSQLGYGTIITNTAAISSNQTTLQPSNTVTYAILRPFKYYFPWIPN